MIIERKHTEITSSKSLLEWHYLVCRWMMGGDNGLQIQKIKEQQEVEDVGHVRLWDKTTSAQSGELINRAKLFFHLV